MGGPNRRSENAVIALTAHVFREDIDQSLAAGCDAHLSKPVKKDALLEAILAFIRQDKMNTEIIAVRIDPDLESLIPQFMENTHKDVSEIVHALSKNDLETIRRIGHSMKSYGTGYGFDAISAMGKMIEAAALKDDLLAVHNVLNEMTNYLENVMVVYAER